MLALIIIGTRAFYTTLVTPTYTKADALRQLELLGERQPSVLHTTIEADVLSTRPEPANLLDITARGVLNVCYQPNEYPSAFYNDATPPQLVGFDIEIAHRMAQRAKVALAFFPALDESEATQLLERRVCDIYLRTPPHLSLRTHMFALTDPIYESAVGLIVRDHQRHAFANWEDIDALGSDFKLGVDGSFSSIELSRDLFPNASLTPIRDMEEQDSILGKGAQNLDAIADMAEEGAAWTLLYPAFTAVVPRPTVMIPVAYAVARDNRELLIATNAWLQSEKSRGTIEELYDYWMLGGAIQEQRPPRWSVIKDVLNWSN